MRYILTYTETKSGTVSAKDARLTAETDTEAIAYVTKLLHGRDVTDITLWRKGDFVILGRESI